jgi:predicted Zn-dependent protease
MVIQRAPLRAFAVVGALLAGIFTHLPAGAEESKVVKPIYNNFSDEEETAMGRTAAAEVEKKYPVLQDVILANYLDHLGQKVAQASRRPQLVYRFQIVDTPAVNAFSLPGGYVYVHRGLLEFVESESELVSVLAHEVGHIVAYHSMNDVARRWRILNGETVFMTLTTGLFAGRLRNRGCRLNRQLLQYKRRQPRSR